MRTASRLKRVISAQFSCWMRSFFTIQGAAAGHDLVKGQIIRQILGIDAAGGHPFQGFVGAGQSLQLGHAAVLLGGEELYYLQTQRHSLLHLAGSGGAGDHERTLGQTVAHHVGVEAGTDDEPGTGVQRTIQLVVGQHRAGTYQHFRDLPADGTDSRLAGGGAEGDLGHRQPSGYQCFCQRHGLFGVVDGDDRDDADIRDLFRNRMHG